MRYSTKAGIKYLIESGMIEVLHANDQLKIQQKKGRAFQGFQEQPIHFPPTFKFIPGTDEYSMKRIPSWTDRVLTKCNGNDNMRFAIKPLYYCSIVELKESDHRPVVAGYELAIRPPSGGLATTRFASPSRCSVM
eukprot:gene3561-13633_t